MSQALFLNNLIKIMVAVIFCGVYNVLRIKKHNREVHTMTYYTSLAYWEKAANNTGCCVSKRIKDGVYFADKDRHIVGTYSTKHNRGSLK